MGALRVSLVPWDDTDFVRTYQTVAADLAGTGRGLHDPTVALEVQRRLRAAGYPNATCYCERTVAEAMAHTARCVVARDGLEPVTLRSAAG